MEIGEQLRKIREFRGLSLSELARQSGVGRVTISQWESGKHRPRYDQLEKVLDVLGITHEQLRKDLDEILVSEAFEKFETNEKHIEVIISKDPAISLGAAEAIMAIVDNEHRKLKEADNKEEKDRGDQQ